MSLRIDVAAAAAAAAATNASRGRGEGGTIAARLTVRICPYGQTVSTGVDD